VAESIQELAVKHRAQTRVTTGMDLTIAIVNGFLIAGTCGLALWLWNGGHITVGAITLAHGAGLIGFSFGDLLFRYWPLILIALGVFLLYQYNRRPAPGLPSAVERIEHDSIFGDFKLTQPGWRLRDVRASSVIGDMKIDLSKADIPDGETVLDLSAVVGDIDVWAPLGLPVALDARCTFVSLNHFGRKQDVRLQRYTDAPADFASSARRVRIQVDLVFGDLTLTRVG